MELPHFVFVGVGKESDLYNDSIITEEMIKKTWKKIGIHKNKKSTSILEDVSIFVVSDDQQSTWS